MFQENRFTLWSRGQARFTRGALSVLALSLTYPEPT